MGFGYSGEEAGGSDGPGTGIRREASTLPARMAATTPRETPMGIL